MSSRPSTPHADVAADAGVAAGAGADVAEQGRGGRLAVGAGDGDDLRPLVLGRGVDGAGEQLDVAEDLDARGLAPCSTVQCGSGWVSGTPGDSIRAAKPRPVGRRSGRRPSKPSAAAASRAASLVVPQRRPAPRRPSRARAAVRPGAAQAEHGDASCPRSRGRGSLRARPPLPHLQGGEADQGQHHGDDPEADHHGGLRPAQLLEVVVDRAPSGRCACRSA